MFHFIKTFRVFLFLPVLILATGLLSAQSQSEPWAEQQLLQPAVLALRISEGKAENLHIYCIGSSAMIEGSFEVGEGRDPANIEKMQRAVSGLPKDAEIVLYCGCCPFANCPNIRPAFRALNNMGFTNHKLLNLTQNLKADWLDKNFPVKK